MDNSKKMPRVQCPHCGETYYKNALPKHIRSCGTLPTGEALVQALFDDPDILTVEDLYNAFGGGQHAIRKLLADTLKAQNKKLNVRKYLAQKRRDKKSILIENKAKCKGCTVFLAATPRPGRAGYCCWCVDEGHDKRGTVDSTWIPNERVLPAKRNDDPIMGTIFANVTAQIGLRID